MAKRKVKDLLKLVQDAKRFQDNELKQRARINLANLKGLILSDRMTNTDPRYEINLAYSTTRTILTSIYSEDPEYTFFIKGATTGSEDIGFSKDELTHSLEYATKVYFKEMNSRRTNRKAILDSTWAGYGVTKIGYSLELESNEKPESSTDTDYSALIKRDEPYKIRINPLDMLFNKNDEDLASTSWVAQVIYKDKEQAKKDYGVDLPTYAIDELRKQDERKAGSANKVKIYEFHDLTAEEPWLYTFAEGHSKMLDSKPYPLWDEENNTVRSMFQFFFVNDNPNAFYPQADLDLIQTQIQEARYNAQKRIEFVRKFSRMYQLKGTGWDDDTVTQLNEGEDGTVLRNETNSDAKIEVMATPTLGSDYYQNIALLRQEIMEILGLTDYQVGSSTAKRKATEAQLVEKGRLDRVGDRVRIVEQFVFDQVDTFIETMKLYKKTTRLFTIQFEDEAKIFPLSAEVLKYSDIDIQVVPGSTVTLDRSAETRRMVEVAQVAQAYPDIVNRVELFKELLKTTGIRDPQRFILPGVVPGPTVMPGADGQTPAISGNVPLEGQASLTPLETGATNI